MTDTSQAAASALPKVHLTAEARIDIEIDLAAYFRKIGENASLRAAYLRWSDCPDCAGGECEPSFKPWHYLLGDFLDGITVDSGFIPVRAGGIVLNDQSDVDEIEGSFRRAGSWRERAFGEGDYQALLAVVPWLVPLDTGDDEEAAEIARTAPGPYDVPLPLEIR